jgi:K+-sensing histidine kinase KdpD
MDLPGIGTSRRRRPRPVDRLRQLAAALGARWYQIEDDDPAQAIVSFARDHQITQIVVGSIQHSWWHIPGGGPILRQIIHDAGASGIDVHLIARREPPPDAPPDAAPEAPPDAAPSSSAAEES